MTTIYLACAALGGLVLVIQFLLSILGLGHDGIDFGHDGADFHGDGDASHFLGLLSIRGIAAAIAFFGIGGILAVGSSLAPIMAFGTALAAGAVAMFAVAWIMRMLGSLSSEGTVDIDRVVGSTGSVYLTIPGARTGEGKVTVTVQNRTMEYGAVTAHNALPTGTSVVVVGVIEPATLEVESAGEQEGVGHAV